MKFLQKISQRRTKTHSIIAVGIDPVISKLPSRFQADNDPFFAFGKWIIEQTHHYAVAYKLNSAFFEALGNQGILSLKKLCNHLRLQYPNIPIIIDAKRGDIGHSNQQYAHFIFEYLQADAVTLQPYLGQQSLAAFFAYNDKGLIILCKTSNSGSGELQNLIVKNNIPLWQYVAQQVSTHWQTKTQADLLLVIGATYPKELEIARKVAPNTTFLVPGIGKQGGNLKKTLQYGLKEKNRGLIISSSRSIIYAKNPNSAINYLYQEINL